MAAQQQQRVRRVILTASVAAITATGAWYGAGLKVTQERKKVAISLAMYGSSSPHLSRHTSTIPYFCTHYPRSPILL